MNTQLKELWENNIKSMAIFFIKNILLNGWISQNLKLPGNPL